MPEEAPATRAQPQVLLAFDFGLRRIGVACGDTVSGSASPLGSVAVGAAGVPWDRIDALMRDYRPTLLVVGLPYNVDGSESDAARRARAFAAELAAHCALPVDLVDERYSSLEAEARLKGGRAAGLRRRRVTKSDVDAGAACVILERWLDGRGQGEHT
jgi:putative Holliday junction resolvase